ncbi:MAG: imidazole glycerol phosphate synthase subunit HisH [Bdellovibrionales bacterium]|nr:imidazole glycerol phosphate synthase subunit HisH [Bdellovibrionales bacterium]
MSLVGVIDCGISNITSVLNALKYLDIPNTLIKNSKDFDSCSHLILPGVGSYHAGMKSLNDKCFIEIILQKTEAGIPLLGICLGMQLLGENGEEFGPTKGLGLIPGSINKMKPKTAEARIPHVGWNAVKQTQNSFLWHAIENETTFYFVHSYAFEDTPKEFVVGTCDHGGEVICAVQNTSSGKRVYGAQFHPEKSQKHGLQLLRNFFEKC